MYYSLFFSNERKEEGKKEEEGKKREKIERKAGYWWKCAKKVRDSIATRGQVLEKVSGSCVTVVNNLGTPYVTGGRELDIMWLVDTIMRRQLLDGYLVTLGYQNYNLSAAASCPFCKLFVAILCPSFKYTAHRTNNGCHYKP